METFKIYRWDTGDVIASIEAETLKEALEKLVANDTNLYGASLVRARLDGASLDFIKHDLWGILLHVPHEVGGLLAALREGRVDGSAYEGPCACLVGTIANVRGCNYHDIPGVTPNSSRPAEVWFTSIAKGDTPETNQVSKITVGWVEEFQKLTRAVQA